MVEREENFLGITFVLQFRKENVIKCTFWPAEVVDSARIANVTSVG